jgi:hypothetical protein
VTEHFREIPTWTPEACQSWLEANPSAKTFDMPQQVLDYRLKLVSERIDTRLLNLAKTATGMPITVRMEANADTND